MDSFSPLNQMQTLVEKVADGLGSKYGLGKLEKTIFQQFKPFISFFYATKLVPRLKQCLPQEKFKKC
jgi:hypothetical protein